MDSAAFVTEPGTEKITIEPWRAGIIFPLQSHLQGIRFRDWRRLRRIEVVV